METPLGSTHVQLGASTSESKLSKAGVVPPALKALTGLIPSSGKGQLGPSDKDWFDFLDRAHTHHPKLTGA